MKYAPSILLILSLSMTSCVMQPEGGNSTKTPPLKEESSISMSCTSTQPLGNTEVHAVHGKVLRKIMIEYSEGQNRQQKIQENTYLIMDGEREYKWKETITNGKAQETLAGKRTLNEKDKQAYEEALTNNKPEFLKGMNCTRFSGAEEAIFQVPSTITFRDYDASYTALTPTQRDAEKIWFLSY